MPKHGPCRLQNYLSIHETVFRQFVDSGFIGSDTLAIERFGPNIYLGGQVGCLGGIIVSVMKKIAILNHEPDPFVQTEMYSYNASIAGRGSIFRYDNQHPDNLHPGHQDPHHKHLFDWKSSEELEGSPIWLGETAWPTLGEVMEELRTWHSDHYASLPRPDEFPTELGFGFRA